MAIKILTALLYVIAFYFSVSTFIEVKKNELPKECIKLPRSLVSHHVCALDRKSTDVITKIFVSRNGEMLILIDGNTKEILSKNNCKDGLNLKVSKQQPVLFQNGLSMHISPKRLITKNAYLNKIHGECLLLSQLLSCLPSFNRRIVDLYMDQNTQYHYLKNITNTLEENQIFSFNIITS
jgi:hypothetical protein